MMNEVLSIEGTFEEDCKETVRKQEINENK